MSWIHPTFQPPFWYVTPIFHNQTNSSLALQCLSSKILFCLKISDYQSNKSQFVFVYFPFLKGMKVNKAFHILYKRCAILMYYGKIAKPKILHAQIQPFRFGLDFVQRLGGYYYTKQRASTLNAFIFLMHVADCIAHDSSVHVIFCTKIFFHQNIMTETACLLSNRCHESLLLFRSRSGT